MWWQYKIVFHPFLDILERERPSSHHDSEELSSHHDSEDGVLEEMKHSKENEVEQSKL